MYEVFIIHGTGGNPKENWFPWMKLHLENFGFKVFIPQFPTQDNQNYDSWKKVFSAYEKNIDENTILVGHSVGATFLLKWLEQTKKKVLCCFLVAGFSKPLQNDFDSLVKSFVEKGFDWDKIKKNGNSFYVYYSDNDPYVKKEQGKFLEKMLNANGLLVHGAGHFNEKSGYTEFPELLNEIEKEGKKFIVRKS